MSGTNLAKLPVMIVALVIGLILTFSAVMPLVSDYSDTKTFTNEGLFYLNEIDTDTESVIVWDHTKPTEITVDDVKIDLPQSTTYPLTLICSDTWGLRYLIDNNGNTVTLFDNTASTKFTVSATGDDDMTITISSGTATFTDGGSNTVAESFTTGYAISKTGDYVMKVASDKVYLNGDSVIYSTGRTGGLSGLTSNTASLHIEGNIDDGVIASSLFPTTYTTSNLQMTYSEVSGYVDLYLFEKVTFTVTDAAEHNATATYSQVIVPAEVSADPDNPAAYKSLVSVLPLFALILLVAAAASLVYFKNKD